MPVKCLARCLDHRKDSLHKWSMLSDLIMSFLYLQTFTWFPTVYRMKFKFLSTAFKTLNDQNSMDPELFQLCPCPMALLPLGMHFSILPVATCPLRPGAYTMSMKHFLIHLVVINHLFSWAPIRFNLYFHLTRFCPMFVLVNSVIRLLSTREWTWSPKKGLNCWIQGMLATSDSNYVGEADPAYKTELQERLLELNLMEKACEGSRPREAYPSQGSQAGLPGTRETWYQWSREDVCSSERTWTLSEWRLIED